MECCGREAPVRVVGKKEGWLVAGVCPICRSEMPLEEPMQDKARAQFAAVEWIEILEYDK